MTRYFRSGFLFWCRRTPFSRAAAEEGRLIGAALTNALCAAPPPQQQLLRCLKIQYPCAFLCYPSRYIADIVPSPEKKK